MDSTDLFNIIRTFKRIGDLHAPSTEDHETRTAQVAVAIGSRLALNEEQYRNLGWGAVVHDFGKMFLDQDVLNKTSKLNSAERIHIEQHVIRGHEAFEYLDIPDDIRKAILYHHEHFDGSGYPERLLGDKIPFVAQIVCVADVWDALICARPYRPAYSRADALAEMRRFRHWFNPDIFVVFETLIAERVL